MNNKALNIKVTDSYLNLIRKFPLRPIRNDNELDAAEGLMMALAVRGEKDLDAGETDYLDALTLFVERYNNERHPISRTERSPLERLRYVLEQSGMTPNQLKDLLDCSQSLVSMILNGQRELSKENVKVLAAHFKLDAGYFM